MIKKLISTGIHDFKELIEKNYYYVDKSMFIHDLVAKEGAKVTVIPRPRRFGKTLNMTMLKYFFEKPLDGSSNVHLFDGLAIAQYPEIMARQGTYPVIFITFKGIKSSTWQKCYKELVDVIAQECERHKYLLDSDAIDQLWKDHLSLLINKKADEVDYAKSLHFLSKALSVVHQTKSIILIDEYDAPMHAGFEFEYYDEIKNFMYNFFCAGLKDNNNLEFAVITGILRVAKESIFSGMNNVVTYSMLADQYADKFGFLEPEVEAMISYFDLPIPLDTIREWYNGYRIGRQKDDSPNSEAFIRIYNPWSIIECINFKAVGVHWINTGGHFLIQETMRHASASDKEDLMNILQGASIEKVINDAIVFRDVYHDSSSMWSFLVFTGYLTWQARTDMMGETTAALIAPNVEVKNALKSMIAAWFNKVPKSKVYFTNMINGILTGDSEEFLQNFEQAVLESLSFFDIGDKGENAYQAFALGIMASVGNAYETISNRESGYGRYDVCIFPKDTSKMGMIIEFKRRKLSEKKPLSTYAKTALEQIDKNNYELEMQRRSITLVAKIGIAFQGKHMAWTYNVHDGTKLIQKGSYSAERAAKAAQKKKALKTASNVTTKKRSAQKSKSLMRKKTP